MGRMRKGVRGDRFMAKVNGQSNTFIYVLCTN